MAKKTKSVLDGLTEEDPAEGGLYLPVGEGKGVIKSIEFGTKEDGSRFYAAKIELTEIERGGEGREVGEEVSYFRGFQYPEATRRELHGFLLAAFGSALGREIKAGELSEADAQSAHSEDQPLTDVEISWVGFKSKSGVYTKYRFGPVI